MPTMKELVQSDFYKENDSIITEMIKGGDKEIQELVKYHLLCKYRVKLYPSTENKEAKFRAKNKVIVQIQAFQLAQAA